MTIQSFLRRSLLIGIIAAFSFGLSGCMVSGGILIEPEPVIIGNPPGKKVYHHKSKKHNKRHYIKIPPGHMPPRGMCRVWFKDRPPGHQPPPVSCHRIGPRIPYGAVLVQG
jgi:hypothetical protein